MAWWWWWKVRRGAVGNAAHTLAHSILHAHARVKWRRAWKRTGMVQVTSRDVTRYACVLGIVAFSAVIVVASASVALDTSSWRVALAVVLTSLIALAAAVIGVLRETVAQKLDGATMGRLVGATAPLPVALFFAAPIAAKCYACATGIQASALVVVGVVIVGGRLIVLRHMFDRPAPYAGIISIDTSDRDEADDWERNIGAAQQEVDVGYGGSR